jgi:hypothetical protein
MRGTPLCKSLKRRLPHSSSRTTSGVHRSQSTSALRETVQNWIALFSMVDLRSPKRFGF